MPDGLYVAETGHFVSPKFTEFYTRHGGSAVFGNPLSEEMEELNEDRVNRPIQYFDNMTLEYHGDITDAEWQVMGRHVGKAEIIRRWTATPLKDDFAPVAAGTGERFFSETNHSVSAPFLAYYQGNGDVHVFGYPLSEAFFETCDDGVARQVQYFERAVLEHHDDGTGPATVQPRPLGKADLKSTYGDDLSGMAAFQRRNADGSLA